MYGTVPLGIAIALLRAIRRKRAPESRSLCAGCCFVHMQYAANGRNALFCTFGGVVRPVQFDVMYCTDFRDRTAPERIVRVGFVPGTAEPVTGGSVAVSVAKSRAR
jgi:hypothetical protein